MIVVFEVEVRLVPAVALLLDNELFCPGKVPFKGMVVETLRLSGGTTIVEELPLEELLMAVPLVVGVFVVVRFPVIVELAAMVLLLFAGGGGTLELSAFIVSLIRVACRRFGFSAKEMGDKEI